MIKKKELFDSLRFLEAENVEKTAIINKMQKDIEILTFEQNELKGGINAIISILQPVLKTQIQERLKDIMSDYKKESK